MNCHKGNDDHGVKDAEPFPKRPALFMQVEGSIAIDKAAAVDDAGGTESRIVV